jgi:hypothetical protein
MKQKKMNVEIILPSDFAVSNSTEREASFKELKNV